jgi:hypothetical protein
MNPKSRQENIVTQEFETEILIYDFKINQAFCLNQTSALVWQLADGKNTVAEISRLMSQKFGTVVSADLVWLALDRLKKDNLLENGAELEIDFNNLTRRQMIKKVGLASLIALPIISSVVAPQAISAQSDSCLPLLKLNCTSNSECCSGSCQPILGRPPACCVPTNMNNNPGFRCAPDASTCDAFAALNCCSGMANFGALALCIGSPIPGDRDCTCSENSTGFIP